MSESNEATAPRTGAGDDPRELKSERIQIPRLPSGWRKAGGDVAAIKTYELGTVERAWSFALVVSCVGALLGASRQRPGCRALNVAARATVFLQTPRDGEISVERWSVLVEDLAELSRRSSRFE